MESQAPAMETAVDVEERRAEENSAEEEEEEVQTTPASADPKDGGQPVEKQETTSGTICGRIFLLLVGIVLAMVTTVTDLAMQGLVSRTDGILSLAALAATRASLSWAATMTNFVFLGGMSLIGAALGQGDNMRAGRYARMCLIIAVVAGLLGTAVLVPGAGGILGLFNHEVVAQKALPFFQLQAMFFPLAVITLALNGILLGFLYVHVVVLVVCLAGGITLATAFPLYLMTGLGLKAFAVATALGSGCGVALSLAYLLLGDRRRKFGLDLGVRGISLADVRDLGGSMGCLAFRSFMLNTPYFLTILLSIRLSPVHGAVFQFLVSQSGLVDNIVAGFALTVNFFGSRLWGARFHAAFWNVLCVMVLYVCTPMAIIFSSLEVVRGRDSLGKTFAKHGEQAYFDAVMTSRTFAIYITFIVARSYYVMLEQAMIAMQELRKVALIQGLSFIVYLCVAILGYRSQDFTVLFLAQVMFLLCRILGATWVLGRALCAYKPEWYRRGSYNDPQYAIKLTIDDPAAARIFGGKSKANLIEEPDFATV